MRCEVQRRRGTRWRPAGECDVTKGADWKVTQRKKQPIPNGAERIWLPGEMEWERQEAALREGMKLPDYVIVNLLGLAEDVGMLPELKAIFR